jgi:hypothetical protein
MEELLADELQPIGRFGKQRKMRFGTADITSQDHMLAWYEEYYGFGERCWIGRPMVEKSRSSDRATSESSASAAKDTQSG